MKTANPPAQAPTPAFASFLWPDHVIGKRESRTIREEHNALVNACAELLAENVALRAALESIAGDSRLVCNLNTGDKYYPVTPAEMGAIRHALSR